MRQRDPLYHNPTNTTILRYIKAQKILLHIQAALHPPLHKSTKDFVTHPGSTASSRRKKENMLEHH
jgi:hypothetical protein